MLALRVVAGSPAGAHSHLSGHGSHRSPACLQAPRPVVIAMPAARGIAPSRAPASGPSSARAAATASIPAHPSASPLRVSTAAVRGGSSSSRLGRSVVQAAAGRGSSRGRAGGGRGGGSGSGGGRGGRDSGRDPADDMTVCQTLEDLQALINQRLSVWEGRKDFITMFAAFNLCGRLESSGGAAATAVARSSTIGVLAPAYLPLVPRIRDAKNCSIPLLALGKAGIVGGGGRTEAQLAAALLERLVVPDVLGKARPQALSNAMYGVSKLREALEYQSAVEALCGETLRRLRTPELAAAFTPQELSNILLALEGLQLGSEQAGLVAAVAAEDVRRGFDGYVPQDLSNSAWALAKMGFGVGPEAPAEQRQWVSAAVEAAMRPGVMARATPQAWSNLLYALSLMRFQPPTPLLDAAGGGAAAAIRLGNEQDCVNMLYAMAVVQLRHAGLEAAVCGRLGELLQRGRKVLTEQGISNSLWAVAVFGCTSSPGMQQLAIELSRDAAGRWEAFTAVEDLTQLWQAQQELGGEVAAALCSSPGLQAAMDAAVAAEQHTVAEQLDARPTSETQKELLAALRRLEQQGLKAAGGLTVQSVQTIVMVQGALAPADAVVGLSDGRKVMVELLGPTRFNSIREQGSSTVDGRTVLRIRQLRRAFGEDGVLLVPHWEWDFLSPSEQEAYLLRRLQQPAVAVEAVTAGAVGGAGTTGKEPGSEAGSAGPAPAAAGGGTATDSATTPAKPAATNSKGGGGSGSALKQQLLARPARQPEGGGGGVLDRGVR